MTSYRPSVDVVIPLHDKAPCVERAVRPGLAQTHAPAAVYVADDAGTDGGPELVARLATTLATMPPLLVTRQLLRIGRLTRQGRGRTGTGK